MRRELIDLNSGSQRVLAVDGSNRDRTNTHGERGEALTVGACMNESGCSWIPPLVPCKSLEVAFLREVLQHGSKWVHDGGGVVHISAAF
jgi:hypothetical protein